MATPQQAAANWAAGMSGASTKLKAGVNAVTTAPTQLAAAAVDRQVAGVQHAAATGKTQRALQAVSLQQWQNAMITKGLPRIASGAQAAIPKMQQFMGQFLPFQAALVAQLPARGDLNTNIQRATQMMQGTSQFVYNKGQG